MMVELIVEDGSGVEGANSYVGVEEADSINEIDIRSTWAELDEDTKVKLLAFATRYLDEKVYWLGKQADRDQSLRWPRAGVYDRDRFLYSSAIIPRVIREATARLAATFADQSPEAMEESEGVRRFRSDLVEIEWQDGYMGRKVPAFLGNLIAGMGYGPDDRGFKKIAKQ